jgi:hypothetical protein
MPAVQLGNGGEVLLPIHARLEAANHVLELPESIWQLYDLEERARDLTPTERKALRAGGKDSQGLLGVGNPVTPFRPFLEAAAKRRANR